jgi:hypothetical protein
MTAFPTAVAVVPAARTSTQALVRLASGLLVMFAAFGFGSWFSGLASWVGFYLGARGTTLAGVAQAAAVVGVAAVVGQLAWYRRRCRRGRADIPAGAIWAVAAA